jgi:thymidylate kinase
VDETSSQGFEYQPGVISKKAGAAHRLFECLEKNGVDFVVVGDVREYDKKIDSDIDIVVSNRDLKRLPGLLAVYCKEHKCKLVQALRHEAKAVAFGLSFRFDGEAVFIHPDVCADFMRAIRKFQNSSDLLDGRIRAPIGFWIPRPFNGFKYYLWKKLEKNGIDSRQLEYLSELRAQGQPEIDFWLQESVGRELGDWVMQSLEEKDLQAFKASMPAVHRKLISKKPIQISDRLRELARWVDRVTRPTGVILGFLGPDGVGKSSVIREVERQIGPAFRQKVRFHLRPHFGKRQDTSVTVGDPQSGKPRGLVGSAAKVVLWWLDYVGGYSWSVYPKLIRSTLVIFDRYADDLAVDPKRYRYGGPLWLARLLSRTVPRPNLMFVLVADPEVIQARKTEVPLAETARQVEEYSRLAQKKGVVLVDAGRELEGVVSDIVEVTLTWMEKRTHKRLGLKS